MSEQDFTCEIKSLQLTKFLCVYLVAHETVLFIEQGLFTKSKNLCFTLKYTIFCLIGKIFTGYVEWASRHPHVKYLSDQTILIFSLKFTDILGLQ